MKGFKLKVNMDLVNTVLLVVILALVVYCLIKQKERFDANTIENKAKDLFRDIHNQVKKNNAAAAAAAAAANAAAANAPMNAAANAPMNVANANAADAPPMNPMPTM